MAEGEHPNCQAIENFLSSFTPSRPVVHTERINGEKVDNGYTASYFDQNSGIGFTAIAWGDNFFKVILECAGDTSKAKHFGDLIARVVERNG